MKVRNLYKFVMAGLLLFSLSFNITAASYLILKFNGNKSDIDNIILYSKKNQTMTAALNSTSSALIQTKNSSVLSNIFLKSFQSSTTVNQLTDPPFTNVGQIYWDNSYNSLVATDGTKKSVWIGSTWITVDSNNNIIGTNQNVNQLISQHLGTIASNSLQINSSGNISSGVQVSNVTAVPSVLGLLGATVKVVQSTTVIKSIYWDAGTQKITGKTNDNHLVVYSVTPDKYGSYWSDATLQ